MFGLLLILLMVGFFVIRAQSPRGRWVSYIPNLRLRRFAGLLGLSEQSISKTSIHISGVVDGEPVVLDVREKGTRVHASLFCARPNRGAVSIRPVHRAKSRQLLLGEPEGMDRRFVVSGDESHIFATFDAALRAKLSAFDPTLELTTSGEISFTTPRSKLEAELCLRTVLALAMKLSTRESIENVLLANVAKETNPAIRRKLFELLLLRERSVEVARQALLLAVEDADPVVQAYSQVVEHLSPGSPVPLATKLLDRLFHQPDHEVHRIVLDQVIRTKRTDLIPALSLAARDTGLPEILRDQISATLGALHGPQAGGHLSLAAEDDRGALSEPEGEGEGDLSIIPPKGSID
jgi:hypothetical protein